jgi:hypothetical protein
MYVHVAAVSHVGAKNPSGASTHVASYSIKASISIMILETDNTYSKLLLLLIQQREVLHSTKM